MTSTWCPHNTYPRKKGDGRDVVYVREGWKRRAMWQS